MRKILFHNWHKADRQAKGVAAEGDIRGANSERGEGVGIFLTYRGKRFDLRGDILGLALVALSQTRVVDLVEHFGEDGAAAIFAGLHKFKKGEA